MTYNMLSDPRPILAVRLGGVDTVAEVGRYGVTKIVCYGEPSHYCDRPYVAVYYGDHLAARHDAAGLSIIYADPEPRND